MIKDSPATPHQPETLSVPEIEGLVLQRAPSVVYKHGVLVELYREEWDGVFRESEGINHLYLIQNPNEGGRGEWHKHDATLDRYMVAQGTLELILWDDRKESVTRGNQISVTLQPGSSSNYSMARIPPGVWHTLFWRSPGGGVLVNSKNPPFLPSDPDKYRLSLDEMPARPTHFY